MISGEPLQKREVRELRRICPGTVSHTGAQQSQQSLICCAKKTYNVRAQEQPEKDKCPTSGTDQFGSRLTVSKISFLAKNTLIRNYNVYGEYCWQCNKNNLRIVFNNISKARTE